MPKAVCPKCGAEYYGWALIHKLNNRCACGTPLILDPENRSKSDRELSPGICVSQSDTAPGTRGAYSRPPKYPGLSSCDMLKLLAIVNPNMTVKEALERIAKESVNG